MEKQTPGSNQTLLTLVSEYEAMSQKGTVGFYEETVFSTLFTYYFEEEQFEDALMVIEYALAQHPYSIDFYSKKAQLLLEMKREIEALQCLDKALTYAPSEFLIQLLRVEALGAIGYIEDAYLLLNELEEGADQKEISDLYLSRAMLYEQQERFEDMFYALRRSILANPDNSDTLTRIWFSVEMGQLHKESIELHHRLIDINAYNYVAWYNLGYAYSALEDHKNACDAFEYAYLINEEFEFAYRHCADACIKTQQYERALRCFEDAMEHVSPDADFRVKMGFCYESLDNLIQAKSMYLKAIKLDPEFDCAYYRIAECFMQEECWESAIGAYQSAVRFAPKQEEYLAALAHAYYQVEEDEQANEYYRKAIEAAPESAEYWVQYATFLLDTGEYNAALEMIEEGGLYVPEQALVYCRVACLLCLGQRQEGLLTLSEALAENFDGIDQLFELVPHLHEDPGVIRLIGIYQPRQ